MKVISIVAASLLVIAVIGYLSLGALNKHIDRESGAVVEETLASNTILQLQLLSELELLLESGEIAQAKVKLSEANKTLVYILQDNCSLPKCEEALRSYEKK